MSELYEKETSEHIIVVPTENTCIMCGAIIPEGRMVCFQCTLAVEIGESSTPWKSTKNNKHEQTLFQGGFWKNI